VRVVELQDWLSWRENGFSRLPVIAISTDASLPINWTALLTHAPAVLLESAQAGRYTYLCDRAERVVLGFADHARICSADATKLIEERAGAPLELVQALMSERKAPPLFADWPPMVGGFIGVFGYDLVRMWENLPFIAKRDLELPLYALIETREMFVFDHATQTLGTVAWCNADPARGLAEQFHETFERVRAARERWSHAAGRPSGEAHSQVDRATIATTVPSPSFTPSEFESAVCRVKEYIAAGDTYQVNLSLRTSRATALSPAHIYQALRRINPSPYMGLLRLPEFSLVCGSPELLVRLVDGRISSRPIAGTRRRGEAAGEDSQLSAELFASTKERAEHLMLVDLIRNDIGRVAEFGSVTLTEFMTLERYSHVMHIVSHVEGQLAPPRTWIDVLKSMFPGGTITGCPKVRTMEIIEELEPVGRGFYTGSLGWISYNGAMEMNIVIRSMLVKDGIAHVQAGAGVVADSQPNRELDEALRKAQALWSALEQAEADAKRISSHD
jgi:para-aminobenzoate synthetase component 1